MKEFWKDIKGYEKIYQISNLGRVKSLERTIIRKNGRKQHFKERIINNWNGEYVYANLFKNGKSKVFTIHNLVANAFLLNINDLPEVNHKDGNKHNNNVNNLEWSSISHNLKEAYRIGLKKPYWKGKTGNKNANSKGVSQYDKNMNLIKKWDCLADTYRIGGYNFRCVSNCCLGKQKQHKGYIWRYDNEG